MKRTFTLMVAAILLTAVIDCKKRVAEYPERDITTVVVWGAGGGTDVCNRVVMAEMARAMDTRINVINKPGGVAGSLGMLEAYGKKADGYTLCGLSESCVTAAVQGGWDKRMNVWEFFNIGGSPDIVSVTPGSPYQTLTDLIEAARKSPKSIKAGAGGSGSIHHLNLLALQKGAEAEFNFIPYPGSAPAQNAAMTGEISVIVTSVAEQAQLIRGGKLRPLAVLVPEAFTLGDKSIPSAFDNYAGLKEYLPISQAIGFAVRKDAPEKVRAKLREAFAVAMESQAVKDFGKKNYYILSGATGADAAGILDKLESLFSWTLADLGTAKVSPEALAIPKP